MFPPSPPPPPPLILLPQLPTASSQTRAQQLLVNCTQVCFTHLRILRNKPPHRGYFSFIMSGHYFIEILYDSGNALLHFIKLPLIKHPCFLPFLSINQHFYHISEIVSIDFLCCFHRQKIRFSGTFLDGNKMDSLFIS